LRDTKRALWATLVRRFPSIGAVALRSKDDATYSWLAQFDRDWLRANTPVRTQYLGKPRSIDWSQRDSELAGRVPNVALGIRNDSTSIRRVTRTAILRELRLQLDAETERLLPLTLQAISDEVESLAVFTARRIDHHVEAIRRDGLEPTREDLRRRMIIDPQVRSAPEVLEALARALS
jgi:hypothetical protein